MNKLINSAMMPVAGNYNLQAVKQDEFVAHLRGEPFESYIGYPDTAAFLERISGVRVSLNRAQTTVAHSDTLLIVRLKYRVSDPSDKSKFVPRDEDYEFFIAHYRTLGHPDDYQEAEKDHSIYPK